MRRFATLIPLFASLLFLLPNDAVRASTASLHPGDVFPRFSAQTMTGRTVTLPAIGADKASVLVFSFTRTASEDARRWNERLSRDSAGTVPPYGILELQSVPRLFRGVVLAGIRSSTSPSVQDRTILLFQNEDVWRARLAVSDASRAYVLLLGPDGRILWTNSGAFSDAEYARLKSVLDGRLNVR